MRSHSAGLACAGLVAVIATAGLAAASPPAAVEIVASATFDPATVLTWQASGAVEDGGTFAFGATRWGAIPSPVVGTLQQTLLLTGARGGLEVRADLVLRPTDVPGRFELTGPWSVSGGTGDYARLRGGGRMVLALDPDPASPDVAVLTGSVHAD